MFPINAIRRIILSKVLARRLIDGSCLIRVDSQTNISETFLRSFSSEAYQSKMRFVQFLRKNDEKQRIGVLSEDGTTVTELKQQSSSDMVAFIRNGISIENVNKQLEQSSSEPITDNITLLSPVTNPEKIICIGLNYSGHCAEQNKAPPKEPMFFSKFNSTIVGPTGDVIAHEITKKLDWEVELAVVIGKEAKKVSRENALDYVFGYTAAQDISARDWQKEHNGGQFLIGKSMDTFCPLGPAIVHKSLIKDPHNLNLTCSINGQLKQSGNTNELIFRIDDIIARLSECITLKPGDVILTGTPSGVGMHRTPPEYLKPGDVIQTEIQCIGKLVNKVVAP